MTKRAFSPLFSSDGAGDKAVCLWMIWGRKVDKLGITPMAVGLSPMKPLHAAPMRLDFFAAGGITSAKAKPLRRTRTLHKSVVPSRRKVNQKAA